MYPVEPEDFSLNQVLDAHWGVLIDEDVRKQFNLLQSSQPYCSLFQQWAFKILTHCFYKMFVCEDH